MVYWIRILAQSDAERSGRTKEVVSPDKIHEIILDDRRMKVREMAKAVGISTGVGTLHFTWIFGHEKAIRAMGAAIHNRP